MPVFQSLAIQLALGKCQGRLATKARIGICQAWLVLGYVSQPSKYISEMELSEEMHNHDNAAMAKLRNYVVEQVLDGRAEGLEPDSPLLEWGVINSIEIVRLNHFISAEFAIAIPTELMVAENYRDLQAIAALVQKLAN